MILKSCILVMIIGVSIIQVSSKPAEEPTKLTLDTPEEILDNSIIVKSTSNSTQTRWDRAMERLGQIMDALRIGRGRLVNFAMMARNIIAERAEEFVSEASNKVVAVIAAKEAREYAQKASKAKKRSPETTTTTTTTGTPVNIGPLDAFLPPKTRENVRLETEAGQSLLEKPKPVSIALEKIVMPKPLLDRIMESEKYGNSGDKFIGVGRLLVNGFEGLSNLLNFIVDIPVKAAKKTSRSLTAALNQAGGKLIGLE